MIEQGAAGMSDAKALRPIAELDVAQQAKIGARFLAKQIAEAPSPHVDWSKDPPLFHYDNPILHHVFQHAPVPDFIVAWRFQVWQFQRRLRPPVWQPPPVIRTSHSGR